MRLLRHNNEDQSVTQRHPKGLLRTIITKLLTPVIFVSAVASFVLISPFKGWVEKGKELEKEQIKKSKEKSKARDLSKSYKKEWEAYLKKASIDFSNNQEIVDEINRIKEILEFSSFFRKSKCINVLNLLKSSKESEILFELRDIK